MTIFFALLSISLAALAQLLLKRGVTNGSNRWSADNPLSIAQTLIASPAIIAGLVCFGVSVLFWLFVLTRMDVSQAYPFISLGIILTMFGGYFFLGEPFHLTRLAGAGLIVLGVTLVALK